MGTVRYPKPTDNIVVASVEQESSLQSDDHFGGGAGRSVVGIVK